MTDNYAQRDLAHLVHPLARIQQLREQEGPAVVVSGEGAEVVLSDGRRMIDGPAGMWCVNVGHGRRELLDAAVRQMKQIAFSPIFGAHSTPAAIEFCELLTSIAPGDLDHVFLVNGGSEANETAIKLARYHWYLKGKPEKTLVLVARSRLPRRHRHGHLRHRPCAISRRVRPGSPYGGSLPHTVRVRDRRRRAVRLDRVRSGSGEPRSLSTAPIRSLRSSSSR